MKQTKYICDRCGEEITDVVYTLACLAEDITRGANFAASKEAAEQNVKLHGAQDLCRACKDAITDGVFIV